MATNSDETRLKGGNVKVVRIGGEMDKMIITKINVFYFYLTVCFILT